MSIATKQGDSGQTSLFSGERVSKADLRIEVNGTLDELDCHLGEARLYAMQSHNKELLYKIQLDLKRIMMEIASASKDIKLPFEPEDIDELEKFLNTYEGQYKPTELIVPGESVPSAKLDICRTVARRAERCVVRLSHSESVSAHILVFLNRLSDVLFIMARSEEH